MKSCFLFFNRDDAKKVEEFLSQQFAVERHNFLGYDTLYVPDECYEQAITEGIKFIISTDITTASWMDVNARSLPIRIVPLLNTNIAPSLKRIKLFSKPIERLCCQYAHNFHKLLGVPVIWQEYESGNIEFYLIRSHEVTNNHAYYMQQIGKYLKTHKHIFSDISICDTYGKRISKIH